MEIAATCIFVSTKLFLLGPNGQKVRIILVPSFAETGIMVLVNLSTLECSAVHISENGMRPVHESMETDD